MGLFNKNKEQTDLNQTQEIKDLSTEISNPNSLEDSATNSMSETKIDMPNFNNPFSKKSDLTADKNIPPIDDLMTGQSTTTATSSSSTSTTAITQTPEQVVEQTILENPITKIEEAQPKEVSKDEIQQMVDETVEQVIEERWSKIVEKIEKVAAWKEKQDAHINLIKEDIVSIKDAFEKLEKRLVNKVGDYDKNIMDVNSEIKALEKVFQKITPTLVNNVNELSKIAKTFKNDNASQTVDEE